MVNETLWGSVMATAKSYQSSWHSSHGIRKGLPQLHRSGFHRLVKDNGGCWKRNKSLGFEVLLGSDKCPRC